MNYNKIRRNIKVTWNIVGFLAFALAAFIVFVLKEELYYPKAMMAVMIYLASDIAINILLWWLGKKIERSNSK